MDLGRNEAKINYHISTTKRWASIALQELITRSNSYITFSRIVVVIRLNGEFMI